MTNNPEKPLVSLIISVYNTVLYLRQCLDSVIAQTYDHWELIVIDDGSTDGSAAICDEYANKDERIRVVHKANSGKPDCCNLAIGMVKGDYVGFIDSDDWVEPAYLKVMVDAISMDGIDFVSCSYINEFQNKPINDYVCAQTMHITSSQAIKRLYLRKLYGYLPGRLFDRELLQEPIPNLRRYEDMAVLHKWLSHGEGATLCTQCLYHYRQRASSIMNNESDRMVGMIPLFEDYYNYIREHRLLSIEENKAIALRNLIRIAKDIARNSVTGDNVLEILTHIRKVVKTILPFPHSYISHKTKHRVRILLFSVHFFTFIMRIGRFFVLSRHHTDQTKLIKFA